MGLQHYGNKVECDGYTFDSTKEYNFYKKFIKDCGFKFKVHEKYTLIDKIKLGNKISIRSLTYKPDFIIFNKDNSIKHVYDVKNGFTPYAIDRGAGISFKLFAQSTGVPVEIVVVRTHDFKTKILGTTKKYEIKIRKSVDYDWRDCWCIVSLRGN